MGRKNKRTNTEDKQFDKFVKSFMNEQKKNKPQKQHTTSMNYSNLRKIECERNRNERKLNFVIEQLTLNNIDFEVIDEYRGLIHCRRNSDNEIIRFYAHSGLIIGYPNCKGLRALILILNNIKVGE